MPGSTLDADRQKIVQIKNGDEAVLKQLFEEYRDGFLKWVQNRWGYRCTLEDAEDIYMISFSTLNENIIKGKLTPEKLTRPLRAYFNGIGKKTLKKWKKDQKRPWVESMTVDFRTPKAVVKDQVKVVLALLDETCQTLLKRCYFDGFSMEAIAIEMGYKNEEVAKSKKWKCLNKLKALIKERYNLDDFYD